MNPNDLPITSYKQLKADKASHHAAMDDLKNWRKRIVYQVGLEDRAGYVVSSTFLEAITAEIETLFSRVILEIASSSAGLNGEEAFQAVQSKLDALRKTLGIQEP
jgi:hypothetical protein